MSLDTLLKLSAKLNQLKGKFEIARANNNYADMVNCIVEYRVLVNVTEDLEEYMATCQVLKLSYKAQKSINLLIKDVQSQIRRVALRNSERNGLANLKAIYAQPSQQVRGV